MSSRASLSVALAVIGGFMLILGGVRGSLGLYGFLLSLLMEFLPPPYDTIVYVLLMFLSALASLGGATVIAGGYLIYAGHVRLGKLLISIGSGTGVIGFVVLLASEALRGLGALIAFLGTLTSSLGWIGVVLCLLATLLARKPEESEEQEEVERGGLRATGVRRLIRPGAA
ncbi:hypothetical protein DRO60_00655 [Candidatus Bathyarchaeota archaeon]|nr:MAG: hypothetical protein DRO60_00655 [Candidatus Bathyarchaeota archaeon]